MCCSNIHTITRYTNLFASCIFVTGFLHRGFSGVEKPTAEPKSRFLTFKKRRQKHCSVVVSPLVVLLTFKILYYYQFHYLCIGFGYDDKRRNKRRKLGYFEICISIKVWPCSIYLTCSSLRKSRGWPSFFVLYRCTANPNAPTYSHPIFRESKLAHVHESR